MTTVQKYQPKDKTREYCPARQGRENKPDWCKEMHCTCYLELGGTCDLRMQLIKEEKEG
jgi:hypothetical protein